MQAPETKYAYRGQCISKALKAKWAANPKPKYNEQRVCLNCGKAFHVHRRDSKKKFCCFTCFNEYSKSYPIRSGSGGKRNRAGRSTRGFFKGIYFTNTDALAFFVYNLNKGYRLYINKRSFRYTTKGGNVKSFKPEFIDECGLLYKVSSKPNRGMAAAIAAAGFQIIWIDIGQVADMVKWCVERFKVNHISELYENRNIMFKFKCAWCGKEFTRSHHSKCTRQFCCQSCAGLAQLRILELTGNTKRFQKGNKGHGGNTKRTR